MPPSPIKAIFFDLGNTLTQTASLVSALVEGVYQSQAGEFALSCHDAPRLGAAVEQRIASLYADGELRQPPWLEVWQEAVETCGLNHLRDHAEQLARVHLAEFVKRCTLRPYALSLLSNIQQAHLPLALISNVTGPPEIFAADLYAKGLAPFFQVVVWSSSVGVRKPHPRIFQHAMDVLGVAAGASVVMVGDSEWADIEGGKRMGFTTVRVSAAPGTHDSAADYVVAHHQLPKLLSRLVAG